MNIDTYKEYNLYEIFLEAKAIKKDSKTHASAKTMYTIVDMEDSSSKRYNHQKKKSSNKH